MEFGVGLADHKRGGQRSCGVSACPSPPTCRFISAIHAVPGSAAGSNENTNGLLRQYFPKGTDLSQFSQAYLNKIAKRLNQHPRETLGFETPADRLRAVLQ
jgi:hypothetical protein